MRGVVPEFNHPVKKLQEFRDLSDELRVSSNASRRMCKWTRSKTILLKMILNAK